MPATWKAVFRYTVRERLSERLWLLLPAAAFITGLAIVSFAGDANELQSMGTVFGLLLGSGLVGKQVSSGALPLTFSRPVVRWQYLLTRWLAACALSTMLAVSELVLQFAILASRGRGVPLGDLFSACFAAVTDVGGVVSVLLFCSTFTRGRMDLGVYVGAKILIGVILHLAASQRVSQAFDQLLEPRLEWSSVQGLGFSPLAITSYLSSVLLFLAAAVVIMNRKELSYASA